MYKKQEWKDEIPDLSRPILDNSGEQKVDPQTGRPLWELVQEGTRITAARLNHLEEGIEAAHVAGEEATEALKEARKYTDQKADEALSTAQKYTDQKVQAITPESIGAAARNHTHSLPDASTSAAGVVRLSSATDSTDETRAATPKAVNEAMKAAKKAAEQKIAAHASNAQAHVSATDRQEWDGVSAELDNAPGKPIDLQPGHQVIESEQDAPFRLGEIKGRTIIPLLSPDLLEFKDRTGSGVVDDWYWPIDANREGKYTVEDGYQKIESLATDKSSGIRWISTPALKVKAGRRYVAVVDVITDGSILSMELNLGKSNPYGTRRRTTSGTLYVKAIAKIDADDAKVYVKNYNEPGKVGWVKFKDIGLYEVSEELYNAIGTTITEDNIRQYLPHTKRVTNVTNPYAVVTGSNQQRSMIAFEAELAANPVDGSDPDTLFMGDDGLPYVKELWEKVVLDGKLSYAAYAYIPSTKQIYFNVTNLGATGAAFVLISKNDGKVLDRHDSNLIYPDHMRVLATGKVFINIANKDSGWADNYTPTPEEIKAYFMGYRMANADGTPYTSGVKNWNKLYNGQGTPVSMPGGGTCVSGWVTQTVPTIMNDMGYTPYRLQYLKAKPTVEPVRNYELGATLSAGDNKVVVGSGIVLRERANPVFNKINHWFINRDNPGYSHLKHKASKINNVYSNGRIDSAWAWSDMTPYGKDIRAIADPFYDPTATYHVTYTMLDPTLTAPISGTVAANLRGTVTDLVQDVGDIGQRLSVAETQDTLAEANKYTDRKVANIQVPVKSVNGKTGAVRLTAADVGAETPSGAQAKANQAEANAKEHTNDELKKVKQRYKLTHDDGTTIRPSDKNLNNLTTTGFYSGSSFINAPTTNWAIVEVFADDDIDVMQRLYDMRADKTYTRRHVSGDNWTPWLLVLDGKDYNELKTHANTVASQAEANAKNASLPINGAANKQGQLTVTQNADAVNLVGTNHVYQRFVVGGELRGYVGAVDPAQPNTMHLVSQKGNLELHGSGGAVLLNGRNVIAELESMKAAPNWITPTLLNGVSSANEHTVKYCKDALGWVHIEGMIKTPPYFNGTIFYLPSGYKPRVYLRLYQENHNTSHQSCMNVDRSGDVRVYNGKSEYESIISLGTISFYAEH